MPKRVYALYRVSTLGQVDPENDIPVQKNESHLFCKKNDWEIVREFVEKGVSGFKVSAKDRDAIQEIQEAALKGMFDVLLVYMFDRLGRKEDETPFIVEWFVENGIEVWSVKEGQQRFDSHVDKLTNYIRFWQASGESRKTAIRTKDGLAETIKQGNFRGGKTPYGYILESSGRIGKRNRELNELRVHPVESLVVKRMFDLADQHGYGARKIAAILEADDVRNRDGQPFHFNTVRGILKNILYTGVLRSGETYTEPFPELAIVNTVQFKCVNELISSRADLYNEKLNAPEKVQGSALLSGNIYCGHCGGRLTATAQRRAHHDTNHAPERIPMYRCYNHGSGAKIKCPGATTYRAEKVDVVVEQLIKDVFKRTKRLHSKNLIENKFASTLKSLDDAIKQISDDLSKARAELNSLDEMIVPASQGNGTLSLMQLQRRSTKVETQIETLTGELNKLQAQRKDTDHLIAQITSEHELLASWADIYKDAPMDVKKMIACRMVEQVQVSRGYELEVKLSLSVEQFMNGL